MKNHFPERIKKLTPYSGRFEAFKMESPEACTYFATYPAGTSIEPHSHDSENCGVITRGELVLITNGVEQKFGVGEWYHLEPNQVHAARFEVDTDEVEFWFKS